MFSNTYRRVAPCNEVGKEFGSEFLPELGGSSICTQNSTG